MIDELEKWNPTFKNECWDPVFQNEVSITGKLDYEKYPDLRESLWRLANDLPVGTVFTQNGIKYKVVEGSNCQACAFCMRDNRCFFNLLNDVNTGLLCRAETRKDEKEVYFVRVEEDGK